MMFTTFSSKTCQEYLLLLRNSFLFLLKQRTQQRTRNQRRKKEREKICTEWIEWLNRRTKEKGACEQNYYGHQRTNEQQNNGKWNWYQHSAAVAVETRMYTWNHLIYVRFSWWWFRTGKVLHTDLMQRERKKRLLFIPKFWMPFRDFETVSFVHFFFFCKIQHTANDDMALRTPKSIKIPKMKIISMTARRWKHTYQHNTTLNGTCFCCDHMWNFSLFFPLWACWFLVINVILRAASRFRVMFCVLNLTNLKNA